MQRNYDDVTNYCQIYYNDVTLCDSVIFYSCVILSIIRCLSRAYNIYIYSFKRNMFVIYM